MIIIIRSNSQGVALESENSAVLGVDWTRERT